MPADLTGVSAALAGLDEGELAALIEATNNVPQTAPGLLAWIESACDWELNRRQGLNYPLQPTDAAIPHEEDAVSIDAAMNTRSCFAKNGGADRSAELVQFDATVGSHDHGELWH